MKILLINKYYYIRGGAERYLFNIQRLLEKRGHTVAIFSMHHPQNEPSPFESFFVPTIDFHEVGMLTTLKAGQRVIWYPRAAKQIQLLLDQFQPDVAHLLNIYHQLSPSILPPLKKRNIPTFQTLNDYKLICPNYLLFTENMPCTRCCSGQYGQVIRHRCLNDSLAWSTLAAIEMSLHKIFKVYEKHVDRFIAPSLFMEQITTSFGISSEQILHLPYFLFPEDYVITGESDNYLAYVGRLSREKGLPTLIHAMALVPEAKLKIIGDGPLRSELENLAKHLKLTNVDFEGYLSGIQLQQAVAGARFTVVPSEWYEVFGLTVIETFSLGKPVIAAEIGGLAELISKGVDGHLFKPGSISELAAVICDFWHHPDRLHSMGMNGRHKVETMYSPDKHYKQLMNLYHAS